MDLERRTDKLELPASTKRLVVLGDPHGDVGALEAVLAREEQEGTAFASVGDNVGYACGLVSSQFCRRLREKKIASVYGNHEAWMKPDGRLFLVDTSRGSSIRNVEDDVLAWIRQLPLRLEVRREDDPLRITVMHTLTNGDWDYVNLGNVEAHMDTEHVDVVFSGHTHGPAIYALAADSSPRSVRVDLEAPESRATLGLYDGIRYAVDAGSLAFPGYHPEPPTKTHASYAILDFVERTVSVVAFSKTVTP